MNTQNHLAKLALMTELCCEYLSVLCYLTVCYYCVTYKFQSASALYNCLNVKEPLAQNRHHIWSLNDNNWIRTHNHLVCQQTFNHLTSLVRVFIYKLSGCGFKSCCCHLNFRYRACFEQWVPWHSGSYRV